MKISLFTAIVVALLAPFAMSDNHEVFTGGMDPQAPMNAQTQLCTLNPGKTMAQYNRLSQKYIAWSKKHDVETTVIRANNFISHDNPDNRSNTDFIEFLVSDHETSAKGWELWLSTPDGQKLNDEWQSIAKCDLKMATVYTRWANIEAMNSSKNRFAMWNWCTRKEGISSDSLMAKHNSIAANFPDGVAIWNFLNSPNIVYIQPQQDAANEHLQKVRAGATSSCTSDLSVFTKLSYDEARLSWQA